MGKLTPTKKYPTKNTKIGAKVALIFLKVVYNSTFGYRNRPIVIITPLLCLAFYKKLLSRPTYLHLAP